MRTQIVMDHTGDTRHQFDPANAQQVETAMQRFNDLVKKGYTAGERKPDGTTTLVRAFNPEAPATVFFPRLMGG